jgi:hypothetical protein
MDDAIAFHQPTDRPLSRRTVLWDELERVHEQLELAPPTATLTLEALEAKVDRLREQHAQRQPSQDEGA